VGCTHRSVRPGRGAVREGSRGRRSALPGSEHLLANRLTITGFGGDFIWAEVWSGYPDPSSVLCWWL